MKHHILAAAGFCLLALASCQDDLSTIGSTIRPSSDKIQVNSFSIDLESRTFAADSIYVRTSSPLLGEITDSRFGKMRSDYMTQLYCQPGFSLNAEATSSTQGFTLGKDSLVHNFPDSIFLNIYYNSIIGDSLAPMQLTVYEVDRQIPADFYSNQDFDQYIASAKSLGIKDYTAKDTSVSDSIRNSDDYLPAIRVDMGKEFSQRMMNAFKNTPPVFASQDSFNDFFKGIYLKNTSGTGSMIQISRTEMVISYRTYHPQEDGSGKTISRKKILSVTPDVIQLNSVQYPMQQSQLNSLIQNDSATFITTPGGYFTEIEIPAGRILAELEAQTQVENQMLNGVMLSIQAFAPQKEIFGGAVPQRLLLVERSKMNDFFEKNSVPDFTNSFTAIYTAESSSGRYYYNFGNISRLIGENENAARNAQGGINEDYVLKMALVPVSVTTDIYGTTILTMNNYFAPGGVILKGGSSPQKIDIVYTLL